MVQEEQQLQRADTMFTVTDVDGLDGNDVGKQC